MGPRSTMVLHTIMFLYVAYLLKEYINNCKIYFTRCLNTPSKLTPSGLMTAEAIAEAAQAVTDGVTGKCQAYCKA